MDSNSPSSQQLKTFFILLGYGVLAHEISWFYMFVVEDNTSLFGYLDAYKQLLPSPQISSGLAGFGHVLLIVLALLMIVHRKRALFAALMFPVIASHLFIQGMKPANHLGVLIIAFGIVFLYQVLNFFGNRKSDGSEAFLKQNDNFLRFNLIFLVIATYLIAANSKLNVNFFILDETVARGFVWRMVAPFNALLKYALGDPNHPIAEFVWRSYSVIGIIATLVMEFGIPIFLLIKPMRRIAFTMGIFFHLFILYCSAIDFSLVMLALYPMVATADELKEFVGNYLRRPNKFALLGSFVLSIYLCFANYKLLFLSQLPQLGDIYRIVNVFLFSYLAFSALRYTLKSPVVIPTILYDGKCSFCVKTMEWVKGMDYAGVSYENFHTSAIPAEMGLSQAAIQDEMHLVRGDQVETGFYAFRTFAVYSGGVLCLVAPLMYLPGVAFFGKRIYAMVAKRRYSIKGVECESGVCGISGHAPAANSENVKPDASSE